MNNKTLNPDASMKWKVGEFYQIRNYNNYYKAKLEGFILNQKTFQWKDQTSYRAYPPSEIFLLLSYYCFFNKKKELILARPVLENCLDYVYDSSDGTSTIRLSAIEFAETKEGMLRKLQNNYVFSKELSKEAFMEENFISPEINLNEESFGEFD